MSRTHVRRRTMVLLAAATSGVLLAAGPALAHASLDVASVPAGSTTDVVLRVPVERADAGNERVEVLLPTGFAAPGCVEPDGWTCTTGTDGDAVLLTFARDDGDAGVDRFGFTLTAGDDEGDVVLPTIQTYTDDVEVAWIGDGGDRPAPTLAVAQAEAPVEENTEAVDDAPLDAPSPTAEPSSPTAGDTQDDEEPSPSPSADATADTAQPDDATTAAEATAAGADGRTVALLVGLGVLAVGGVLLVRRRAR